MTLSLDAARAFPPDQHAESNRFCVRISFQVLYGFSLHIRHDPVAVGSHVWSQFWTRHRQLPLPWGKLLHPDGRLIRHSTYVYAIARNRAHDLRRTLGRFKRCDPAHLDTIPLIDPSHADIETQDLVQAIRGRSSPLQQKIISAHLRGLNFAEIADFLGIADRKVYLEIGKLRKKFGHLVAE